MAKKSRSNTPRALVIGETAATEADSEAVEEIMETDLLEILETVLAAALTAEKKDTSPETAKNVTSLIIQPASPDNSTEVAIVEDTVEAVITTDMAVTEIATTEEIAIGTEEDVRTAAAEARATIAGENTEEEALQAPAEADDRFVVSINSIHINKHKYKSSR